MPNGTAVRYKNKRAKSSIYHFPPFSDPAPVIIANAGERKESVHQGNEGK